MANDQEPSEDPAAPRRDFGVGLESFARTVNALGAWVVEHQEQIRAFKAYFLDSLADVQAEYAALVEGESVRTLMQHGWFPDFDLAPVQVRLLAEAFASDPEQANEVNEELCIRFRDRVDGIERELKSAFLNRSEILSDAFQAHRQGQYNLSVAVFLTQADGLFYDRFLKSLFYGRDRAGLAERIEEMPDGLTRSLSRALMYDSWPLALNREERAQQPGDFNELNRHQVLHGEVTDYGTEENSLKAISLLNYCAFVLPEQPTSQ